MRKATPGFLDLTAVDAADHVNYLFTGMRGYVSVATMDRSSSRAPTEKFFQWPSQYEEMIAYIINHQARPWCEVWLCPYPLRTPDRTVGNSSARYIVHADIDTPPPAVLRATLRALGFRVVRTGTPGHIQAYARLSRSLTVAEHRYVEGLLRNRLTADAKIADNDWLKIPGGTNWKNHTSVDARKRNETSYPVTVESPGRRIPIDRLLDWLDADLTKADEQPDAVRHTGWKRVAVPMRGRPPWVQALADEQPDGDRSKRCYTVVRGVAELGQYTDDQIHTLLDQYEPGVDKYATRWHAEIDRILAGTKTQDVELFDQIQNFWNRRPILQHIHTAALASYAGPWGALGVVLLRALHVVRPNVVLPDLGGGIRTLNLYVALIAKSGGGKDTAMRAGASAVDVGAVVRPLKLGSGEGIAKAYRFRGKDGSIGIKASSVMFDAGEISTWTALLSRTGSTLHGELLTGFAGGGLGFSNADDSKTIPVDADSYRMGVIVSAQPHKCGPLFGEAASGLPQRFLYLPLGNVDQPDDAPELVAPYVWEAPEFDVDGEVVVAPCESARTELRIRNRDRVREVLVEDPLDSHWPVIRLRVACAFAFLDGRRTMTEEDWELAGTLMVVSRRTRDAVVSELRTARLRTVKSRAAEDAVHEIEKGRVIAADAIERCAGRVVAALERTAGEWVSSGALKQKLAGRYRDGMPGALAQLVKSGAIEHRQTRYRGQPGNAYRVVRKGQ